MTPVVDADFREVYLGEWEGGLLRQKAVDRDPMFERVLREQRWDVVPGAESREVFGGRLRAAIGRIADAHPGGRVVAFSHGAAIGEIIAQASGATPFAFLNADNASISEDRRLARALDRPRLQRHGPPAGLKRDDGRRPAQTVASLGGRSPSWIMPSSRWLCSCVRVTLMHMEPRSCIRSDPSRSVRTTPAS